jgi:hypothetical protein
MATLSKNYKFMEEFLEAARNGNAERLGELIQLGNAGKNLSNESIDFDINYRGKRVCSFHSFQIDESKLNNFF